MNDQRTRLFLYTEAPTRRALEGERLGRTILASDELQPEDASVYDECVPLPPSVDVAATLRALERLRFDEVVVQTEYALGVGSLLARARGLAAISPAAALLCSNKWLCRRALSGAGLPVPRFALVRSSTEARRFAERFPIVLKPLASTMGRHVMKVDRPADLDEAVGRLRAALPQAVDVRRLIAFAEVAGLELGCDPEREFLVEDYVEGEPLETDGLLFGREADVFGVTRQMLNEDFHVLGYLFPVARPELVDLTRRALSVVGLADAGFSVEFRGRTLIELNGRLGEDAGFPELFRAGLGEYPILKWLAGDRRPSRARGAHALAYKSRFTAGTVRLVPAGSDAHVLVAPGRELYDADHPAFNPHLAYALRSHPSSVETAYRAARAAAGALAFSVSDPAGEESHRKPGLAWT